MRKVLMLWTMAGSVVSVSLGGCTAEQTQEAKAPDVDVDVDAGQWPRYKVQWAEGRCGATA